MQRSPIHNENIEVFFLTLNYSIFRERDPIIKLAATTSTTIKTANRNYKGNNIKYQKFDDNIWF